MSVRPSINKGFRINSAGTGQFERTLVVAEDDSYVGYLEGCTAPQRDENQLHAAVVELICKEMLRSTLQNWYAGDDSGKGGIYNFVINVVYAKEIIHTFLDSSRGRFCNYLEVSELYFKR